MTLLQRLDAVLVAAIKVFLIACFSTLVALVTYQVISRLTGFLPAWHATEELARGVFIWLVLVGASLGVRNQEHFALQLQSVVNSRYAHVFRMAMAAVILMVAIIFVIYGWDFLQIGFRRRSLTTGLTSAWFYASVFVSGVLMLLFCMQNLLAMLRHKPAAAGQPPDGSL